MATQRRNALSNRDALLVTAAAIVAGLLTSFAGCQPTGQPLPDAVICFARGCICHLDKCNDPEVDGQRCACRWLGLSILVPTVW